MDAITPGRAAAYLPARRPWYKILYIQVLIAIAAGILLGHFLPDAGKAMKPLGDGFIALIRMMIAPLIFCTVVHGIASMSDLKKVGRIGVKTLLYFEVVSTFALALGLIVGELGHPGSGFNIDAAAIDPKAVSTYVTRAKDESLVAHLMAIIPDSFFGALARGDLLQVLLVSILSGFAISLMGKAGEEIASPSTRRRGSSLASSASDPVAGDPARHRQVHERMPRADQPGRQRRRHRRDQPLGRRA